MTEKKKAPAGQGEGNKSEPIIQEQEQTMSTIIAHTPDKFDTTFALTTASGRVWAELDTDRAGKPVVALLDDLDSSMRFTATEALAVAAALQALAVHLLEEPREIRRVTEPGSPEIDGVGGGL